MTSRKLMAVVLAFFGPWGVGHFHLGRRKRAGVWLAVAIFGLLAFGALVPNVGPHTGWGVAVALPFVWMLLVWMVSFLDLLRVDGSAEGGTSQAPDEEEAATVPVWQTVAFFAVGLLGPFVASLLVRAFVLSSFVVPTQSMQPTVLANDHLFASKNDHRARYGDVIVLASPEHPEQMLVKRVIAMPNDTLEMKQGRPLVNGWRVPSCTVGTVTLDDITGELDVEFLADASYLVFYDAALPGAHAGPIYASPDGVLVLGDDRMSSADSRTWHHGLDGNVPSSALRGRALFVWLRTSPIDTRHFGIGLDGIVLPSTLAHLKPQVDHCLATRPNATPPAPLRH